MKNITFNNIQQLGKVVIENELFIHIHHPEMLLSYDSNYLKLKRMPSLVEFKEAEQYLRTFHLQHDQKHVKFYFPQNEQLSEELRGNLSQYQYQIGLLELYTIQPKQFPVVNEKPEINIQPVTKDNLESYLKFQFEQDLRFGKAYAEQKQGQLIRNFHNENILQVIAYYYGIPAGSLDVIISNDTIEIDGFYVLESFQKKGIGSLLQKLVMDQFHDKTVILVANAEDTARDMYRKQNYHYLGFRYEVMKVN